jgi:signal transduction histidine kinase
LRRERIDLALVGRHLVESLHASDMDRAVEFTIIGDLVCDVDPRLFEIVLQNLLGNAWKFTKLAPLPSIELGCAKRRANRVFYVRDNGVGFDPAHAELLFRPFQRLHTQREFPGTGIGLAIVRRITERHGGRVWAEGAVGLGATVSWTLP